MQESTITALVNDHYPITTVNTSQPAHIRKFVACGGSSQWSRSGAAFATKIVIILIKKRPPVPVATGTASRHATKTRDDIF